MTFIGLSQTQDFMGNSQQEAQMIWSDHSVIQSSKV